MRLVLDGKSVAVGLFAGAALVASLGAMQKDEPQVGRFQIAGTGGQSGGDAYVVDTATGRIWPEPQGPRNSEAYAVFLRPKLDAE